MHEVMVPDGSIYFWMYTMGLKQVDLDEIKVACFAAGKTIRDKDYQNYWNGYYNSDLYHGRGNEDIFMLKRRNTGFSCDFFNTEYFDYPDHPYLTLPDVQNRWVPCSKDNKPMIKWSNGCMSIAEAKAYKDQVYLAENLKGTKLIVIDCDGDHGDELDLETVYFLNRWRNDTHCLTRPDEDDPAISFHLMFMVDKIIPTMHFPYAHIDIVGNRKNSLRYWKNKKWNHVSPIPMSGDRWKELQDYIKYRKEKANGNELA